MKESHWNQFGKLIALLGLAMGMLVIWSFAVPVYEAPDEPHHWRFARYLHDMRRLPVYTTALVEANSPPLYYLLIAPLASGTTEPQTILDGNYRSPSPPRWFDDSSRDLGKYWPIRLARLATVVISTLTVLFVYLLGREAGGDEAAGLLAGGIVAFLPQFTFRGMNVSNDSLVAMLCAAAAYLMVRMMRRGFTWRLGMTVAIVSALAFLTKTNAIFLPLPLILAIISTAETWKTRVTRLALLGLAFLIVTPWLIRNQMLYGDPLASRVMLTVVANIVDIKSITSPYFLTTFPVNLYYSFVGIFGWMNLRLPLWIYLFFGALAGMAALGYLWRGPKYPTLPSLTLVLLTFPVLSLAITVYINLNFSQPQGRYLFPALGAIAVLVGLGLKRLPFWTDRLTYGLLGLLLVLNLYILGMIVVPAYWS